MADQQTTPETVQNGAGAMPDEQSGQVPHETPVDAKPAPAVKVWAPVLEGDIPKVGERAKCRDGEGKIEWIRGPNVQVRLDSGYISRTGLDGIRVLR